MTTTTIKAESAAFVAEVYIAAGDVVAKGAPLLATELMKMRHDIRAPFAAHIDEAHVQAGDELQGGEPLVTLRPADVSDDQSVNTSTNERSEFAEFESRMALIDDAARPEAVAKRHGEGFRTARENIVDLFDPGSFTEYGALAVAAQRTRRDLQDLQARTQADGIICGTGLVGGRPVACLAVDYMVLAGTQGYFHHRKMDRLLDVAKRDALPLVILAEGGGGRPGDFDLADVVVAGLNLSTFRHVAAHKGPKIGVANGYCFAGNAAIFGVCDLRIATQRSFVGMGGPAMIEGGGLGKVAPTEIGPSDIQTRNGVIDLLVADEAEAVAEAKRLIAMAGETTPTAGDDAALRDVVPADRGQAYDMRVAVTAVADTGSWLELRRNFGIGLITGFARIKGRAVGVMANNPLHLGGAIDAGAGDKGARFLQLCDAWALPVVTLCDTPGFMVGPEIEEVGQVAHISRLFLAGAHFSQPLVTVILRKGYGLGAMAMAGGGFDRPDFCCAWPTGEIGAMGLEGAVKLGHRDQLAKIEDPGEREAAFQTFLAAYYERGKALNAASMLEFDAVIDPADTRDAITRTLAAAGPTTPSGRYVDAW